MSDKCTINPNVNNNQGGTVPSPLFEDLKKLCNGDVNQARNLWSKIDNDENRQRISELPDDIKEYYPGTNDYSLYMYLMVSDTYKEIDQDKLKDLLLDKFELKNLDAHDVESLSKVVAYLDSNWATLFALDYDKFTSLGIFNFKLVEPTKATDKIANEFRFAYRLFEELSPVFGSLGISNTALKNMIFHFRTTNQRVQWSPIFISSMFVKMLNYFNNMSTSQSIPREIGYILKEVSSNDPLYARIRNIIDKDFEKYISRENENPNLTEEELKDIAFCNVLAIVINNKPIFKDLSLDTLVKRYIKNVSVLFSKLANNPTGNGVFKDGLKSANFIEAVYRADNATSTVLDDNFFTINPELRKRDKNNSMIDRMQSAIEQIIQDTAKLISIERKIESRSKVDTYAEDDDSTDNLRRDRLPQLDSMNWSLIKSSNSIDEITLRGSLNKALNQCKELLDFINKKMAQIQSLDLNVNHALNAEVAENLRDYKMTVDYLQQILSTFRDLGNYEESLVKGTIENISKEYRIKEEERQKILANIKDDKQRADKNKKFDIERQNDLREKEAKIRKVNNKVYVNSNIKETIYQITNFIPKFESCYIEASKKILSKELQDVIGNDTIIDKDGKQYTVKEYIDKASNEGIDDLGLDRWLASMAQCNNPILSLISQYKKIRQEAANQRTQLMIDDIYEAAEILKKSRPIGTDRRSTKFMFRKQDSRIINKYVMDYDIDEYSRQLESYINSLKQRTDIPEETKRNLVAKWKEEHTEVRDDLGGHRFPSRNYFPSAEFAKFTEAEKQYWHTFMALKIACENEFPNIMFSIDNAIVKRKDNWEYLIQHRTTNEKLKKVSIIASPIEAIGKMWHDTWQYTSNDVEIAMFEDRDFKNRAIYALPIYYSRLAEGESMDDMSLDTTTSLCSYIQVFNRSAELSNILGVLEGAADVIESFKYNYSDNGDYISSILKTENILEHYENIKSRSISFSKKANKSYDDGKNTVALYKDFLRRQVYGKYHKYTKSKSIRVIVNGFIRFTAFRTLGLKIGPSIANVVQAYVNFVPELAKRQHFTFGDFIKAEGLYLYNILPFIFDLGAIKPSTHASLWSRKMDIMQDFSEITSDVNYKRSRFQRIFNTDILFSLMHLGEHKIQHLTAYSMVYNKQNELIDNSGNKYNPYSAYYVKKENGVARLFLRKGLSATIKGKQYEIVTNEEIEKRKAEFIQNNPKETYSEFKVIHDGEMSESAWIAQLSQKVLGTNQYMHGVYNKEDSNAAQAAVWTNLLLMYRRYLYPSLKRRYGKRTYNAQIGSEQEGFYATARRVDKMLKWEKSNKKKYEYDKLTSEQKNIAKEAIIKDAIEKGLSTPSDTDIIKAFEALPKISQREILYGTKSVRKAVIETLEEYEKGNLRAFKAELATLSSLMLANLAFALFDDDDDDDYALAELKYQLRRAQTELSSVDVIASQIAVVWFVTSVTLQNFADVNIGYAGGVISETTQLINSPVVGTNLFGNTFGANPLKDLTIKENYDKPYEGEVKAYKGMTKAEVALRKLFPFLDWEGQLDPEKVIAQKNWYGNID